MSTAGTPEGSALKLTLPHGDPLALELTSAIHRGDLDTLGRLVAERPRLASARMIGRNGLEGGWRTPLHAAADWPGYFPGAPAAVVLLLEAGADPNDDNGGDRPETPLHWAASSDDVDVAVALIDGGAELETPGGSIGTQLRWRPTTRRGVPTRARGRSELGTQVRRRHPVGRRQFLGHPPGERPHLAARARRHLSNASELTARGLRSGLCQVSAEFTASI